MPKVGKMSALIHTMIEDKQIAKLVQLQQENYERLLKEDHRRHALYNDLLYEKREDERWIKVSLVRHAKVASTLQQLQTKNKKLERALEKTRRIMEATIGKLKSQAQDSKKEEQDEEVVWNIFDS